MFKSAKIGLPILPLILMVLASSAFMINSSLRESATMDELAHIPAGYGYVKYLDYRLNPEHPPLVKTIAAFPLLFQSLKFPTESKAWKEDVNGQWESGALFLYESGNDADKIIQTSRIGPIILTLILIIFVYVWSKELIGRWWALLPTFLLAFSPAVLAHGHYVTTDLGAALGIFVALYYFVKFLLNPSGRRLVLAGLAFGLAQLLKFSAVLLIPFFIFLIFVFYLWKLKIDWQQTSSVKRIKRFSIRAFRYLRSVAAIFIIGYALVFITYSLFAVNYPIEKQVADTKFVLASFADGPDPEWKTCGLNSDAKIARRIRCLAEINIWLSENKILRPLGQYMLGVLMVMQRSAGGNTGYFLGEVSAAGWWYYFPVVFALKEPLPSLIFIALAFIIGVWDVVKKIKIRGSKLRFFFDYLGTHFAEFSMIAFVVFYWAYSIKSPLNIGIRHILPTMPFIYILSVSAIKKWTADKTIFKENFIKTFINIIVKFAKLSFKTVLISFLFAWYFFETIFASPHFLSYFNQFGGGVDGGYRYVADSNYDWGQDLKRLKKFVEDNKIKKIGIDYFGGGNPEYYLGEKVEYWWSSKGNPKNQNIEWLAVSINSLQGALGKPRQGFERKPEDEYRWLQEIRDPYEPDFKAGSSIFIYKF